MGLSTMKRKSPLNIISVFLALFSIIGPNTNPIIRGATGYPYLLKKTR